MIYILCYIFAQFPQLFVSYSLSGSATIRPSETRKKTPNRAKKAQSKNLFLEMLVLPINEPPSPSRKIRVNIYGS